MTSASPVVAVTRLCRDCGKVELPYRKSFCDGCRDRRRKDRDKDRQRRARASDKAKKAAERAGQTQARRLDSEQVRTAKAALFDLNRAVQRAMTAKREGRTTPDLDRLLDESVRAYRALAVVFDP